MSRPFVTRATSLAASTGLLALAIAGAMSVTYTVQQLIQPDPPTLTIIDPEPPAPPPLPHNNPPPVQQHLATIEAPPVATQISTTSLTIPDFSQVLAPPTPPTITNPRWLQTPHDLARYYPARALQTGTQGSATLDCLVDVTGHLNCTVVAESPGGWNFGAAALRISQDYRMAPALRDGQAVEARYRMRMPFEIPR